MQLTSLIGGLIMVNNGKYRIMFNMVGIKIGQKIQGGEAKNP